MDANVDYCASQLRREDYPRYVIPLVLSRDSRACLWALYAFNLELARIPSVVTEEGLRAIRYQWWRDAVARPPDAHPVLKALYDHARAVRDDLASLVDAHEQGIGIEDVLCALSLNLAAHDASKIEKLFQTDIDAADPLLSLKLWWRARFS